MKKETKLFWKFFFQQKGDEIWAFMEELPMVVVGGSLVLVIIGACVVCFIFIVGNAFWFLMPSTHLLCKVPVWSFDNVCTLGFFISIVAMVFLTPIYLVGLWIYSNVKEAKNRVKMQMKYEKEEQNDIS